MDCSADLVFERAELCEGSDSSTVLLDSSPSASRSLPDPTLNSKPVIGILSHPYKRSNNDSGRSYIPVQYVEFVKSADVSVIPLGFNEPRETLFEKLDLVDAVLFTGGWAKEGLYYETVQELFERIKEKKKPLFAICLGFELLCMIISQVDILEEFNALNHPSTLQFRVRQDTELEGTVFQRFSPELLVKLTTDRIVMHHHKYGISLDKFEGNRHLFSSFKILTTTEDKNQKVYVSTFQGWNCPVFGFQWHPEKNPYKKDSPLWKDVVQVRQQCANFIKSEAMKSSSNVRSVQEVAKQRANLIDKYPIRIQKYGNVARPVYVFTRSCLA